jgi:hypothetical protein
LKRLSLGRVNTDELHAELFAQYQLFIRMVGQAPPAVNGHHHCHIFPYVGAVIRDILAHQHPKPFVRMVGEGLGTLTRVPGARVKRFILGLLGAKAARRQRQHEYPGTDRCAGITDPPFVQDPEFFTRWLRNVKGETVELTCHPGELDMSLEGRDGTLEDGQLHRRAREYELLKSPDFMSAVKAAGFTLQPANSSVTLRLAA